MYFLAIFHDTCAFVCYSFYLAHRELFCFITVQLANISSPKVQLPTVIWQKALLKIYWHVYAVMFCTNYLETFFYVQYDDTNFFTISLVPVHVLYPVYCKTNWLFGAIRNRYNITIRFGRIYFTVHEHVPFVDFPTFIHFLSDFFVLCHMFSSTKNFPNYALTFFFTMLHTGYIHMYMNWLQKNK
jgi:hypothetical protein